MLHHGTMHKVSQLSGSDFLDSKNAFDSIT